MAKTKAPASDLVPTVMDTDFGDPEPVAEAPRGSDLAADMEAIREARAKQRAARGPVTKRRKVTNYHDAERLAALLAEEAEKNKGTIRPKIEIIGEVCESCSA